MTNWSSKDSLKVYNVPYWGAGLNHALTRISSSLMPSNSCVSPG